MSIGAIIVVVAQIEITVPLTQYNESQWTITDLRKEARLTALRKLADAFENQPSMRLTGEPKMQTVITEAV